MLKGIIPNLLSPMDKDGHPDVEGIHSLVNYLLNSGVGGFWVLGSAGEDIHISHDDRLIMVNETINAINRQVPAIIGLGTSSYFDILRTCERIDVSKITGFHFLPYDIKMGEGALIRYITKLADSLPAPLWLYHNPKRGRIISDFIVKSVKDHPNIHGIKVGGYSLTELTNMMLLRSSDFDVVGAGGGQIFQLLSLGAGAHMTSDANCYPEIFTSIFNLFEQGLVQKARELQFSYINVAKKIPHNDNGEYAAEEKYILSKKNICQEYVNVAYRLLTNEEKEAIDIVDKQIEKLCI